MSIVYSYIRFSSKKQELGDSVRRQLAMGEGWLKQHPEHTLNTTLRLRDLGVSAFRGKNLDKDRGDLGKFIQLARDGKIEQGSILMLENLDRFSRQETRKAYRVFCELVETGVKVLTLAPEQLIDETNIDSMEVVLPVIIKMQLSFEESRKKSLRIAEQWETRRQRARDEGKPMSNRCPSWLRWDDKAGKWVAKPRAKETLTYIFKRTCEGIGQARLTIELRHKFKPFSSRWHSSMVGDILNMRTVLGEMTPRRRAKPQPPIIGYYPRMIPDALWYRARAAATQRRTARGRTTLFVNLFVGLVKMTDNFPAHIQAVHWTSGAGRKVKRRLVSSGHRERIKGACKLSVDYFKVERYVLALLYQLQPDDLFARNGKQGDKSIREKEQELVGVEHRVGELEKALANSKQPVPQLLTAIGELQTRREALKGQIENLRQQAVTATAQPVKQVRDILATLATKPEPEQHDLRLKLRGLIAALVEGVELDPYRVGQKTEARIKVIWRDNPLGWGVADTGKVSVETIADVARDFLPRLEQRERTTATTKPTTAKPSKRRPVTRTTKRTKRAS